MPRKLPTPCRVPGCPQLGHGGRCAEHAIQRDREREQRYDAGRGSAASRGYDAAWRKARLRFLREHPLCRACKGEGRIVSAAVVDHVIPFRGNTTLLWDESNWQALCKSHHDQKTNRSDGGGWRPHQRRV